MPASESFYARGRNVGEGAGAGLVGGWTEGAKGHRFQVSVQVSIQDISLYIS